VARWAKYATAELRLSCGVIGRKNLLFFLMSRRSGGGRGTVTRLKRGPAVTGVTTRFVWLILNLGSYKVHSKMVSLIPQQVPLSTRTRLSPSPPSPSPPPISSPWPPSLAPPSLAILRLFERRRRCPARRRPIAPRQPFVFFLFFPLLFLLRLTWPVLPVVQQ